MDKAEIAAIYDETLILNRLINDLRELAQAEAGQLSLNVRSTNIASLIANGVDAFAELSREKNVALNVDVPPDLPAVPADPDRIRQVLHNLLSNALRHTPDGGTISVIANKIEQTDQIKITVTDTGPGIPAEDLPHVFDRFWRADRSRSREHGGSGLGLAIARQLVEAHGGQIGAESEDVPGQGSLFWFTLPGGDGHGYGRKI
jgi:signal transduction histidine kinase